MKRAFIAAPLLGTLIFLVCVLAIISMARAEKAVVAETVSDAYHNRLVSIVEIYRSDLGSLFNIGLQRNIEYGLTSQCWENFISLRTESSASDDTLYPEFGADADGNGVVNEQEERRYVCKRASDLIQDVVCSKDQSQLYGLSQWAKALAEETSFEGITLEASNKGDFVNVITFSENQEARDICKELLPHIETDCDAFGNGEFKCCSEKNPDGSCISESMECSPDQFFIRVSVTNDEVYSHFPRITASDSAGNKIRAGAIADSDYDAAITYPFFKYLDAAFEFNKYVALGKNRQKDGAGGDLGASRGIVEGSCIGSGTGYCPGYSVPGGGTMPDGADYGLPASTLASSDVAELKYAKQFFSEVIKPACDGASDNYGLTAIVPITGSANVDYKCDELATLVSDAEAAADIEDVLSTFEILSTAPSAPNAYLAYVSDTGRKFIFEDTDPATQVRPSSRNSFCWFSRSQLQP